MHDEFMPWYGGTTLSGGVDSVSVIGIIITSDHHGASLTCGESVQSWSLWIFPSHISQLHEKTRSCEARAGNRYEQVKQTETWVGQRLILDLPSLHKSIVVECIPELQWKKALKFVWLRMTLADATLGMLGKTCMNMFCSVHRFWEVRYSEVVGEI